MCHCEQDLESKKGPDSSADDNGEVIDAVEQLNASRQFMEEIDHVTARLLDNVIYDVISDGIFDSHREEPVEESQLNGNIEGRVIPEVNADDASTTGTLISSTGGTLLSQASQFMSNVINEVSEPVETAEYQTTAQHFLADVLDQVEALAPNVSLEHSEDGSIKNGSNCFERAVSGSFEGGETDFVRSCNISEIDMKQVETGDMKREITADDDFNGRSTVCSQVNQTTDSEASGSQRKLTSGGVMFYIDAGDQKPALRNKPKIGKRLASKIATKSSDKPPNNVTESEDFEDLIDGLIGQIIHEALTLYNPLFQFYKASGSLQEVTIDENPLEVGSRSFSTVNSLDSELLASSNSAVNLAHKKALTAMSNGSQSTSGVTTNLSVSQKSIDVIKCSVAEMIMERKVFDIKRWICISRPQYKFSCGMSSVVSCFNFLYSTLGYGDLEPVSQEVALKILEFSEPFSEIKFGPFTGNKTLKSWFHRLCSHFKVRGYYYTLYKPKGAARTSISEQDALKLLKEGLQSCNTAFIYHCYNHYMCPVGFEVTPEYPELAYADARTLSGNDDQYPSNTWILIGDTSRKHQSIHSRLWEDIVLDLNCESPYHYDIRKPYLGIFKGPRPQVEPDSLAMRNATALFEDPDEISSPERLFKKNKKSGNLHCIMAMTKLRPKLTKKGQKSVGVEFSDNSSFTTAQSKTDYLTDEVVDTGSSLSIHSKKSSDISEFVDVICSDTD